MAVRRKEMTYEDCDRLEELADKLEAWWESIESEETVNEQEAEKLINEGLRPARKLFPYLKELKDKYGIRSYIQDGFGGCPETAYNDLYQLFRSEDSVDIDRYVNSLIEGICNKTTFIKHRCYKCLADDIRYWIEKFKADLSSQES